MSGWSLAGFLPLLVTSAVAAAQGAVPTVLPTLETRPVIDVGPEDGPAGTRLGDADDPAVWLHPTDPARSLVAGTLKDGGLDIYNLRGEVVQSLSPAGVRYNNVDVLYGFPLAGRAADLFVASDRYRDVLAVYAVDPATLRVRDVTDPAGPLIYTEPGGEPDGETTAYGLAAYYDPEADGFYAFVSRRETNEVAQLRLTGRGGAVGWEVVRRLSLTLPERYGGDNPQVEGMVVDAELGVAYLAQEQVGIWKVALGGGAPVLSYPLDGEVLTADAEGLTIYYGPNGSGYLLVSSQGSSTFAVFERAGENRYLGSFRVGPNGGIDPADESDGAVVLNVPLGDRFPQGLLVVHDGLNAPEVLVEDDGELENASTNFKFVPWERVAAAFDPPLRVYTQASQP